MVASGVKTWLSVRHEWLDTLWERAVEPHESIIDERQRRQARLLSAMLLLFATVSIFTALIGIALDPDIESVTLGIALGASFTLMLLYRISRSKYYQVSIAAVILLNFVCVFVLQSTTRYADLRAELQTYYVVVVLVSSLLLPFRTTVVLGLLAVSATCFTLLWFRPALTLIEIISVARPNTLLTAFVLMIAFVRHQDQRRLDRQAQELAEERNLLYTLIESMPDEIYAKDVEGHFLIVNRALLMRLSLDHTEQILGKTDFDFFSPQDAQKFRQRELLIYETGEAEVNVELQTQDRSGRPLLLLGTKTPLRNAQGQIVGVVGVNRDITRRQEVEKALLEERNLLRTVIDNIPDLIYVKDAEGRFLLANRATLERHGFGDVEEIIGQTDSELFTPESAVAWSDQERRIVETGEPVINLEFRPPDFDPAAPRFYLITKVPVRDGLGRIIGLVGINRDIYKLKEAEAQRMELALERERVSLLRRFISDMSHDLRNPLATINTSLYLFNKLIDEPAKRQPHMDVVLAQLLRLQNMLEDMLSMSRLDQSSESFQFEPQDLETLLSQTVNEQRSLTIQRDQTLTLQLDSDLPQIMADGLKLNRAITNLIINAINYTQKGGHIVVRAYLDGQRIVISVADNGQGISADDLPLIFERFYRADPARGSHSGGSGLGLAITRRIINAHGGEITVESTLGQGSTFRIYLPIVFVHQESPNTSLAGDS